MGAPAVLLKSKGDATHPRLLRRGGRDSCIQLRLRKGHGGESSHCVPLESGGREPLSQDTVLCPGPCLSWGRRVLALCLAP